MQDPVIIYCYDAYCGWCYGFSKTMQHIAEYFEQVAVTDVLSGGMVLPEKPVHIGATAGYILNAIPRVEEITGASFGADYLWHLNNPDDSDWYPHSEKAAIALCVFKEYYPEKAIDFAADLQFALHFEGRDLNDDEAYRHLAEKYGINEEAFYTKLSSDEFKEQAHYEFALVKQLQVTSFPTVLVQTNELKFHLVAQGFTDFETLKQRITAVLTGTD